jgi:hypothetical protein
LYKTVEEVTAALAVKLDASKTESSFEGFTVVPWYEVSRQLDNIFGPFGWSERIVSSFSSPKDGVYSVTREVTVTVVDGKGNLVTKTVAGVGTSVVKGESGKAHKTAAMGADSLSFSKATKKLGDAFGLYLYDKDDEDSGPHEATPRTNSPKAGSARKGDDIRPSDKQLYALKQAGFSEAEVDEMPFKEWKATLDKYFEGGRKPLKKAGKPAAKASKSFVDEDEDEADY